ncbi:methionyl-tRNA formyltransferase [Synechocystis sp. PCC 6803]|uniref:Methionyl-tRNA formyltransferase n=1 Tax=Synechocystis sp. (strain ATCC 27184 / PCC 6803 / Kazusa) TaxID=1111708 RepID=FMT_SYNY3|nr:MULTISPECIES: methionyl-tRNA formyltransferase [unclassified Synechocystis]Q55163.1 RecName: Full=Methionyl-tRNA formyltransferase [Synechocystis sp. PCC 6803 substr. Kazusa]MBD2616901.1 methionyl-tRNA formyltransferase [Synechocystis sp. FACHB-898]MBD2638215.1 methionyl-tRNA formyltransferase [Synechocystis sp. FACHB-908]MBD2661227.1 methionyl-tRNA formyltransferase [Synechocystis sp. FACHB-929]AGF52593.1 methionyl-tRNA formyltransferase [Synechocystis sp. PCC 6803]AVP90362.1 methionyl-tR
MMKTVFFGTPDFAVPTLEALLGHPDIDVLAVVSQPDRRRGRGSKLIPSPVKEVAVQAGIPVWQPERVKRCQETLAKLKNCQADFFVVVAYGQLLSPEILVMPRLGCVNVHGSLLPKYRGAAPLQWAIANGETETGVTTMLMDEGMDTGAMLLKTTTPIGLMDNLTAIGDRLARSGAELLVQTLKDLDAGQLQPIPQTETEATYAPLLKKGDFVINWHRSALEIHNQVRGFAPACHTAWGEQILKIISTVPLGAEFFPLLPEKYQDLATAYLNYSLEAGEPGNIIGTIKNWGPVLETGNGHLLLEQVQPPGKKPQSGWDFINGNRSTISFA